MVKRFVIAKVVTSLREGGVKPDNRDKIKFV
jgi:hypothetical protein